MLIASIIQNIYYVSVNSKIDWCVSGEKHQPIDYPNNEFKIDSIIKRQNFI